MTRIDVVQLIADGFPHLRAFDEVAASLAEAITARGYDCDLLRGTSTGPGRNIIIGAHLLDDQALAPLPDDTIIYNFEQITDASLMPPSRLPSFARFEVWEYAAKNITRWAEVGVDAPLVEVGWSPNLETIDRAGPQPIDVLFYGSINERRKRILLGLERAGLHVDTRFGVYGAQRDALIARAKVVLNVHYYPTRILEMVRLSYLLANAVPVVSEWAEDLEIPDGLADAVRFAAYDDLVESTADLVRDPDARAALAERGREQMRARPWTLPLDGPAAVTAPTVAVPQSGQQPPSVHGRRLVLVVGARRSGTAAVTRALHAGGFALSGPADAQTLVPASAANPVGFWEDQQVGLLNDQILALAGSRWDALVPPELDQAQPDDALSALRRQIAARLDHCEDDHVVIKDPRITLLLPLWLELAAAGGWDVSAVLVVRAPLAVARSMEVTHGFHPTKSALLWLSANLFGEAYTRAVPRSIVDYETLLAQPSATLERLHREVGGPGAAAAFAAAGMATIDQTLDRNGSGDPGGFDFRAARIAQEVHAALLADDHHALDRHAAEHLAALEMFAPLLGVIRQEAEATVRRFL